MKAAVSLSRRQCHQRPEPAASAVAHGVGRLVLSSTANLFDRPAHMPIAEDEAIVPGSPYGESKLSWNAYSSGWTVPRGCGTPACATSTRPEQRQRGEDHDPETHLIPLCFKWRWATHFPKSRSSATIIRRRRHLRARLCPRNRSCTRPYFGLASVGSRQPDYNLGNGQGFTVKEVIQAARTVTGHPIPVEVGPRRPGDPAVLIASSRKSGASWSGVPATQNCTRSSKAPGAGTAYIRMAIPSRIRIGQYGLDNIVHEKAGYPQRNPASTLSFS